MKKNTIFRILGLIVIGVIAVLVYRDYKFNNISSDPFNMNIAINKDYKDISVIGEVLYYRDKNTLYGVYEKKDGNEVLFSRDLGDDVQNIIYDKYIYIVRSNGIELLKRNNGKTERVLENIENLSFAEKHGNYIFGYTDKRAYVWSLDLKNENKMLFDQTPAKFRKQDDLYSAILIGSNAGTMKTRYQVFENDTNIYDIASVDEAFLYSDFIDVNKHIVVTNRYVYLFEKDRLIKKVFITNPIAIDSGYGKIAVVDYNSLKVFNNNLELEDNITINFEVDKVKIRNNSITVIGDRNIGVYENKNLVEMSIGEYQSIAINDFGTYIIFDNRIEKVKSY